MMPTPFIWAAILGFTIPFLVGALVVVVFSARISAMVQQTLARWWQDPSLQASIEAHFSTFVRQKLPQKMPVLNMFLDEPLAVELDTIFKEELTLILPTLAQTRLPISGHRKIRRLLWQKLWPLLLFIAAAQVITCFLLGIFATSTCV